jgi:hypothetical protein
MSWLPASDSAASVPADRPGNFKLPLPVAVNLSLPAGGCSVRPPSSGTRHVAALHFPARLISTDGGMIPKLTPLSRRGPHVCGSLVALCRLASGSTFMFSKTRQGIYPFAKLLSSGPKQPGKKRKAGGASRDLV